MTKIRSVVALAATTMCFVAASITVTAAPAQAVRNRVCESGELCLYWGNNLSGALADYWHAEDDFASDFFMARCCTWQPGHMENVKNNAASAWNKHSFLTARVYYNENYTGPFDDIGPWSWRNLRYTLNDNASFGWY